MDNTPRVILLIFPILLIVGFLLVPIGILLYHGFIAFAGAGEPLPPYFWPHLFTITGNTFLLGFFTTFISLLISVPLAFILARTDIFGSRFWLALLTIPLITPPFIMAFATLSLYGRSGVISILLGRIGIRMPLIFGLPGLVLTQMTVSIPYATFIIAAGLHGVPRHIEESAASMGAHPIRIWINLTLPCVYPHLVISGLMIFLISIGDVGGPLIIGGGFPVIASEIYTSFLSVLNDERIALIFSFWIIILSFILLSLVNLLLKYSVRQYRPGRQPVIYKLYRMRTPITIGVIFIILFLLLPFIIVLAQSLGTIWTFDLTPQGWTVEHYIQIFRTPKLLRDTLFLALTATPVIIIMGLIMGHTMYIRKKWRIMNYFMIIPFVLPGVVLAVGVLQSYAGVFSRNHEIPFYALLVLTIIMRRLPYSLKTLEAGFLFSDPRREEAARSLGSNQLTSFLKITLPQIKPFVFASIIIGLIKTATELSSSLILAPPNWRSLPLGIVYFIEQGQLSRAAAMSVVLVAIIGVGTFATAYWSQSSGEAKANDHSEDLERLVLGRTPISFPRTQKKTKRTILPFSFWRYRDPFLIVDGKYGIIEANRAFLLLSGAHTLESLQSETSFSALFFGDRQVLEIFTSCESIENRATSIMILNGARVPIILNAYILSSADGDRRALFYCRRVSGHTRRVKEYSRLRERMAAAEQTALKAQITPHFLFNSLNSVVQLIESEPLEAKNVVQNLADLYRYILYSTKKNFVTVNEEIESIRNYLAIEKSRFGSRLNFEITISPLILNVKIPPMMLQPIVENAVNYGARDSGDIDISISVSREGDETIMRVADHGSKTFDPGDVTTGTGTGLKNVEGRLFALYHRKISYESRKGGGLIVTIGIPEDNK